MAFGEDHRMVLRVALVVVLGVATSCGRQERPPATAKVNVVSLTTSEYRFAHTTPVPAGRVVFKVNNAGRRPHEVVLATAVTTSPGPKAAPGAKAEVAGAQPRGYVPAQGPGARASFAVDLVPGRYLLACFVADPDGVQHDAKGMRTTFRVR